MPSVECQHCGKTIWTFNGNNLCSECETASKMGEAMEDCCRRNVAEISRLRAILASIHDIYQQTEVSFSPGLSWANKRAEVGELLAEVVRYAPSSREVAR